MNINGQSKTIVGLICFGILPLWLLWWVGNNPLPDGYQNEYLHVGNAYDLWGALRDLDIWHLRWYMYTTYWPWGFYAVAWPSLAVLGKSTEALILSNLWFYLVLCLAMIRLSKRFDAPLALPLLLLCPAVFGAMTRFEPNFANIAITALGLLCLVESDSLNNRRWTIGWGLSLGVGLMLDRLTVLFYLLPPIFIFFKELNRQKCINLGWALISILLCTAAYYREFLLRHTEELSSQAPVGEIDSTGLLIETGNSLPFGYYFFTLVDSQAGPFIGLALLIGVALAFKRTMAKDSLLWLSIVPAVLFFTIIAKKQAYYSNPILVPLVLLAGRNFRISTIALIGGIFGWLSLGIGVGNIGKPWLPESIVAPRYVLARPPSMQQWPIEKALKQLSPSIQEMVVFSDDHTLYEGFLSLKIREKVDGHVRGITLDPIGVWEFLEETEYFLWMTNSHKDWPTAGQIEAELISDHYDIKELPALSSRIESMKEQFEIVEQWPSGEGRLWLFQRRIK